MSKLKVKKKNIIEVDYDDFEKLVNETYGGDYSFVADIEGNNYSSYDYDVPSKYHMRDLENEAEIRKGIYPAYCTQDVIQCLWDDGMLEEGEYIIKVFW